MHDVHRDAARARVACLRVSRDLVHFFVRFTSVVLAATKPELGPEASAQLLLVGLS